MTMNFKKIIKTMDIITETKIIITITRNMRTEIQIMEIVRWGPVKP